MKPRKTVDLQKTLLKKGFALYPEKNHHQFYFLEINGIKQHIYTYFSHSKKEYDKHLMGQIKKQLKFRDNHSSELFFDCPMSKEDYIKMLENNSEL